MSPQHALVAGASGTIGQEILRRLLSNDESHVYLLMRGRDGESSQRRADRLLVSLGFSQGPGARVHVVDGDVTEPLCGLRGADLDAVRQRVTVFYHGAAVTHLNAARQLCQRVNIGGTREALRLAWHLRREGRLERFAYFSTAFAPGSRRPYHSPEDALPRDPAHANHYEWSKYHAEISVRESMRDGLPAIILRPSIVVGDSVTGRIPEFKVIYPVLRLFVVGALRLVPARPDSVFKIVPLDFVAEAAVAITKRHDVDGKTFHLVARTPPTLQMMADLIRLRYPEMAAVEIVPPAGFDARRLPAAERAVFGAIEPLLGYLTEELTFDTRNTEAALAGTGVEWPTTGPEYLQRLMDYAVAQGYFRSAGLAASGAPPQSAGGHPLPIT